MSQTDILFQKIQYNHTHPPSTNTHTQCIHTPMHNINHEPQNKMQFGEVLLEKKEISI